MEARLINVSICHLIVRFKTPLHLHIHLSNAEQDSMTVHMLNRLINKRMTRKVALKFIDLTEASPIKER